MSIFENIKEGVRASMREFLQIQDPQTATKMLIEQDMTHEVNTALHKILYRTDAYETEQAFKSLNSGNTMARFWSSAPGGNRTMRKIRNDLYQVIIDTYSDICTVALNKPKFRDKSKEELFDAIFSNSNELNFWTLTKKAITDALKVGDGAFKISIDTEISEYPIVEFFDAEFVDYKYKRGHLVDVLFYSNFKERNAYYTLKEDYGIGYIRYKLFRDDKEIPLTSCERTKELYDIEFQGNYIMAQPFKIWESPKYANRGKPLMDGKIDEIDALDEVISQWMDALRKGRVNKYIPDSIIPKNENGDMMRPNAFDNDFIKVKGSMNEDMDQITVVQPNIQYDAFLQTYVAALDRCLMGIISPSSIGIDARKLDDNATAQREREKITSWRRNQITDVLEDVLPALINKIFKTYANMTGAIIEDTDIEVYFDDYCSPGIEQKIEIASKGAAGNQILTYKQIAEIICDDKTEEEQQKIADELKELNNPTIEEPAMYPTDYDKTEEIEE